MPQPYAQAQDGKTEMSLVHFSLTHPGWVPPQPESETFVQNLRGQAAREAEQLTTLTEEELAGELNRRRKKEKEEAYVELTQPLCAVGREERKKFLIKLGKESQIQLGIVWPLLCFHQNKKC